MILACANSITGPVGPAPKQVLIMDSSSEYDAASCSMARPGFPPEQVLYYLALRWCT
jgi:hypothetical protein